jgi:hypothetical protein
LHNNKWHKANSVLSDTVQAAAATAAAAAVTSIVYVLVLYQSLHLSLSFFNIYRLSLVKNFFHLLAITTEAATTTTTWPGQQQQQQPEQRQHVRGGWVYCTE